MPCRCVFCCFATPQKKSKQTANPPPNSCHHPRLPRMWEALRFSAQPMDVTVDPLLQRAGAFQQLVREAQLKSGSQSPRKERSRPLKKIGLCVA